ncbi:acyltransferase [Sunxiuqinia sp. A32]|uniref:acyltransferase n=1 Tax=Sunxiuqinia sp. A32 TaxID=3461496 RepID=UPI004045665C
MYYYEILIGMNEKVIKFIKDSRLLYNIARRIQRLKRRYKLSIIGRNNKIKNKGVLFNVKYDIVGDGNVIEIGVRTVLSDMKIYIRGNKNKFKIGEDCFFRGGSIWFEDDCCSIQIGDKTTVESAHLAVTESNSKIVIGNDCMFSNNIEFRTGDSHSILDTKTGMRINYAQNIEVHDHVWIGAHSIVLKGVTIGENSIIGTKSLVTKDVPSGSIAAGIPAKVVRSNVDWLRERVYK